MSSRPPVISVFLISCLCLQVQLLDWLRMGWIQRWAEIRVVPREGLMMGLGYSHLTSVREASQGQRRKRVILPLFNFISSTILCLESNPLPFQVCGLTFFLYDRSKEILPSADYIVFMFLSLETLQQNEFSTWGITEKESSYFQQVIQFLHNLENGKIKCKIQWLHNLTTSAAKERETVNIIKIWPGGITDSCCPAVMDVQAAYILDLDPNGPFYTQNVCD